MVKEPYPIQQIKFQDLAIRFEAENNKTSFDLYKKWEHQLYFLGKSESEKMNQCFADLKRLKQIVNYFIVTPWKNGRTPYYILIGNQRYTCLRGMFFGIRLSIIGDAGTLDCRITTINNEGRILKMYPYKPIPSEPD